MDEDNMDVVVEEVEIPVDPMLGIKQLVFDWETDLAGDRAGTQKKIMDQIKSAKMAPFYTYLCEKLGWKKDAALAKELEDANAENLKALQAKQKDADENLGETEVHDCMVEIVDHYFRIGDRANTIEKSDEIYAVIKGTSKRLDLLFQRIRLGYIFNDLIFAKDNINKANEILKTEGDWERRNRLKVYEGMFHIVKRDFNKAATLLLESLATFSSSELMDFKSFIYYTILVTVPTLARPDLKSKVIESSEVLSVIQELPACGDLLTCIYQCKYSQVFPALDTICEQLRRNVWLAQHTSYFYREVRHLAFKQFLASYRSVTLDKMANAFAIPVQLLDNQLCCFIAANRLTCKIDKVSGKVITAETNLKNKNYQLLLKNGDLLLNRVQKLARIVGT
eukprot:NODE_2493_length_1407_cov_108.529595_g2371_i0.p1 GENE.NODE_2493_length_1407_cov_108.529595_g2371_i0~~NODE_2493_length_1407_cov_108.529595_g2371_i0.p1  ORF type:complete len:394 (-),score=105.74 NODE_2493_length_1407_cov_108.529595_g2371_i0:152-1333(-)